MNDKTAGAFPDETIESIKNTVTAASTFNNELDQCIFSDTWVDDNVCRNWEDCIPSSPPLPTNNSNYLRDVVLNGLMSAYHMVGTCEVDEVVQRGTLEVKGVDGLYISDMSVLARPVDTHPLMTAMTLGLLLGENTPALPSRDEQYEV